MFICESVRLRVFVHVSVCVSFSSLFRQPSPTLKPFPSQSWDRSGTEMETGEWRGEERMKTGWLNHETAEKQTTDE